MQIKTLSRTFVVYFFIDITKGAVVAVMHQFIIKEYVKISL
ncbi:hypothetical protein PALI_a3205 [Pseudoalteromonas aliena SW19]|uniref:Uncharacterized protein n=1 Tax=Pseudoalteromonas aliena SW19 TaxID=1314866 RepID=A0ABR9DU98_9GAMM|nr:hypothetical protein [Pseudoalteromonas aliena SW19]